LGSVVPAGTTGVATLVAEWFPARADGAARFGGAAVGRWAAHPAGGEEPIAQLRRPTNAYGLPSERSDTKAQTDVDGTWLPPGHKARQGLRHPLNLGISHLGV
jgi:hypothetical protein